MAERPTLARALVTVPALFVAVMPPIADLNETHLLNPLWTGHARLHTAWLISSNSLLSLFALWAMWRGPRAASREGILTGAAIMGAILGGFLVAAAARALYEGSFADPNGVPLVAGAIDANLLAFSVLFLLLVAAVALVRRPTERPR